SHLSSLSRRSVARLAAAAGAAMPPAAAAIAAASSLRTWRRSSFSVVMRIFSRASGCIDRVEDECGRIDVWQQRDGVEGRADRAGARRIDHDDELPLGIAAMNLATRDRADRGFDLGESVRPRLHQYAGDLGAGRRNDALGVEQSPGNEVAAID